METASIRLGAFELEGLLGVGGMGRVYLGRHLHEQVKVAVKVITGRFALDPIWQAAFRAEVRAVAALSHPAIVSVFDYGRISPEAERLSEGALVSGSPYLVMELASGGALLQRRKLMDWPQIRGVLLEVLDALGHAHARGVLHRDIKPDNIMLAEPGDMRPGWKLMDFGIAHALSDISETEQGALGTPAFMAPEQFTGRWRRFGPWTDLYALGCTAWWLVSGAMPFRVPKGIATREVVRALARAHMCDPLPTLSSTLALPEGFGAWLQRMLAKSPRDRFEFASDAARALRGLDGEIEQQEGAAESWRRADPGISHAMVGVGLGIYGLRHVPLVGRGQERDVLWGALGEVEREGSVRMVVLQGAAGVGKSALARWLCERGQEVGAARVLRATHSPNGGPADGLARMLLKAVRGVGLDAAGLQVRLREHLGESPSQPFLKVLADLLARDEVSEGASGGPRMPLAARYGLLYGALCWMSVDRPLVVWMDDVQWGEDALGLCGYALKAQGRRPAPVLVVLTARDESLSERPVARLLLREVKTLAGVRRVSVGPLDDALQERLLGQLLHLEAGLTGSIRDRTRGNPLFAIQLVGDWVSRGLLRMTPRGFGLAPGVPAVLPDNLYEVWSARLDEVLRGHPAWAEVALELAAALGLDIDQEEWRGLCARVGVGMPEGLLDDLLGSRLAQPLDAGWSFAHAMMREALERRARERGRWRAHHAACADMLGEGAGSEAADDQARLAGHLQAAGREVEALGPLGRAMFRRIETLEFERGEALVETFESLVEAHALVEDERFGWVAEAARVRLALYLGDYDRAQTLGQALQARAGERGWDFAEAVAMNELSFVHFQHRDFDRALALAEQARAVFERFGDRARLLSAVLCQADIMRYKGRYERGESLFNEALGLSREIGGARHQIRALTGLADIAHRRQRAERAEALYRDAIARAEALGILDQKAVALNNLADMRLAEGAVAEAGGLLREAIGLFEAIGAHHRAAVIGVNLAAVFIAQRQFDEARGLLEAGEGWLADAGDRLFIAVHALHLLTCRAASGDLSGWGARFDASAASFAEFGVREPDVARSAEMSAELLGGSHPVLALKAALLAHRQWRALGDEVRVRAVEGILDALRSAPSTS